MTGTFVLQFRNTAPVQHTTVDPNAGSQTISTSVEASFLFDSNEGETKTVAQTVTPSSGVQTLSLSATFTFQAAGTYTVSARGTVTRPTTITTVTPNFDPNTHAVLSTTTTTRNQVATNPMSVKVTVTVTAP